MKFFLSIIITIAGFQISTGQETVNQEFVGIIATENGQKISFKIIMNEISNGVFKGYSISNYDGEDYTKSKIEGKLDMKKMTFSFNELNNVETKSNAEESTFCYVSAKGLKIKELKNKNIIAGEFEGLFPSGEACASGVILLTNGGDLKEIEKINTIKKPIEATIKPIKPLTFDTVLTSNEEIRISAGKSNITLEVWDGYFQDDDEIAIYLNNKLFKERIVLENKKTIIEVPNSENIVLKILALNEGSSGINTVNFRVKSPDKDKEFVSMLRKGESFTIDFNKD